jgi:hypothetical protein
VWNSDCIDWSVSIRQVAQELNLVKEIATQILREDWQLNGSRQRRF